MNEDKRMTEGEEAKLRGLGTNEALIMLVDVWDLLSEISRERSF